VVTVTDLLDPNLDVNSLQFTQVGFGDTIITIPPDAGRYFQTSVPATGNGATFNVAITLRIDPDTRLITARFQSLDPATELPPEGPYRLSAARGRHRPRQGFFSYLVAQKPGLPTGAEIRNVASITSMSTPPSPLTRSMPTILPRGSTRPSRTSTRSTVVRPALSVAGLASNSRQASP